jgi:hypothetical protein
MFGGPGKNLSATGPDDAQSPFDQPGPLPQSADEAGCRELGQWPYEEIQNLRECQPMKQTSRFLPLYESSLFYEWIG